MDKWQELLHEAVQSKSKAQVARELNVSRTAVSLLMADRYCGRTDRMAARIIEVYGRLSCPYLGSAVSHEDCLRYSSKIPTSSPSAIRHWRACQGCPYKPLVNLN